MIFAYNKWSSSKNNLYIEKFYLENLRQAVSIFGAKLWNEIPGKMRDVKKVFKRKLNVNLGAGGCDAVYAGVRAYFESKNFGRKNV